MKRVFTLYSGMVFICIIAANQVMAAEVNFRGFVRSSFEIVSDDARYLEIIDDQGNFSDQAAWKMFALNLMACVQCCNNRVEVVEELLHLVKMFEAGQKFPEGIHAQLTTLFKPDDGIGEFLIGDLERRKRDRDRYGT